MNRSGQQKLMSAAIRAGYKKADVTEKWCEGFLHAAHSEGRKRSMSDSFKARYDRTDDKSFVCFGRILVVYEGGEPFDFHAIADVAKQIVHEPDRGKDLGRDEQEVKQTLYAIAVSIGLASKARYSHRVPNFDLTKGRVIAP